MKRSQTTKRRRMRSRLTQPNVMASNSNKKEAMAWAASGRTCSKPSWVPRACSKRISKSSLKKTASSSPTTSSLIGSTKIKAHISGVVAVVANGRRSVQFAGPRPQRRYTIFLLVRLSSRKSGSRTEPTGHGNLVFSSAWMTLSKARKNPPCCLSRWSTCQSISLSLANRSSRLKFLSRYMTILSPMVLSTTFTSVSVVPMETLSATESPSRCAFPTLALKSTRCNSTLWLSSCTVIFHLERLMNVLLLLALVIATRLLPFTTSKRFKIQASDHL